VPVSSTPQSPGPVTVVTGAGSGIGRAAAVELAARGHRLVLAGRRADALAETAALCDGPDPISVPTDVRDGASIDALFAATTDAHGRVDVLFNNAGVTGPGGPPDEIDPAAWSDAVATNLTGCFLCARAAFGVMRRQDPRGGRIINNGSIAAHTPRPGTIAYSATKHAITGLTKSLALDGRAYDIACGQIDIGNAATDMIRAVADVGALQPDGTIRQEPTFDPAHVGEAVVYMACLPLSANVQSLTVMATKMPFVGRG